MVKNKEKNKEKVKDEETVRTGSLEQVLRQGS